MKKKTSIVAIAMFLMGCLLTFGALKSAHLLEDFDLEIDDMDDIF
jgi:hypothetical protein